LGGERVKRSAYLRRGGVPFTDGGEITGKEGKKRRSCLLYPKTRLKEGERGAKLVGKEAKKTNLLWGGNRASNQPPNLLKTTHVRGKRVPGWFCGTQEREKKGEDDSSTSFPIGNQAQKKSSRGGIKKCSVKNACKEAQASKEQPKTKNSSRRGGSERPVGAKIGNSTCP